MQLVPLAITCNAGACPTVYADADDASVLWVQGWTPDPAYVRDLPTGEAMVRIPRDLLVDAASSLPQSPK
ncbi:MULTISPECIES: hypothetical protein [Pseudofrankia]|uniref:hypothetical protein n=1 Tax=Pseudofrankia TaxID=2994363 RepID=UPI000234CB93|nr:MULTISPECIES: hypothetical protein [Pseudofrankia]OHV33001.1 hypothetical protein BCD49_28185 [Pseudofrankia sp. EUN1h]